MLLQSFKYCVFAVAVIFVSSQFGDTNALPPSGFFELIRDKLTDVKYDLQSRINELEDLEMRISLCLKVRNKNDLASDVLLDKIVAKRELGNELFETCEKVYAEAEKSRGDQPSSSFKSRINKLRLEANRYIDGTADLIKAGELERIRLENIIDCGASMIDHNYIK